MKKQFKTAMMLALLSMAAVGCQKETTEMFDNNGMELTRERIVTYSIDGVCYTGNFPDEASLDSLYSSLFALARAGHTVTVFSSSSNSSMLKTNRERVVYTTDDKDDAQRWAKMMRDYDATSGTYICTAEK